MTEQQGDMPDLAGLRARAEGLLQQNMKEMMALGQMGAELDPSSLMRIRLDTFIDFIFSHVGNTTPEMQEALKLSFEVKFEETLAKDLNEVKGEVRKAMLGLGAQVSPQDMKKMWLQSQRGNGGPQRGPGGPITPG